MKSSRADVNSFLTLLKDIIEKPDFDAETDFFLNVKRKSQDKNSTYNTLHDLGYNLEDVIEVLNHLTIKDYSQTLVDVNDNQPPFLFVFGPVINKKTVYIKLKIKGNEKKYIICVSFHYADHQMIYPYA